jgi:hypothetical protein
VGVQSISETSSSKRGSKRDGTVVVVAEEIEELLLVLIDGSGTIDERCMFGPARAEMGNDG